MTQAKQVHVIFESQNGDKGRRDGWLDYCREEPKYHGIEDTAADNWAKGQALNLSRRLGVPLSD